MILLPLLCVLRCLQRAEYALAPSLPRWCCDRSALPQATSTVGKNTTQISSSLSKNVGAVQKYRGSYVTFAKQFGESLSRSSTTLYPPQLHAAHSNLFPQLQRDIPCLYHGACGRPKCPCPCPCPTKEDDFRSTPARFL